MVVTPKLAAVRTPGPAWPMGSAVPGLIHIDKAARGARDSICPSAWVRFSVWTHGLDCLWVRGLVCSARRGAMAKVAEACDLTRKLAHDDRAKDARVYGFESLPSVPASSPPGRVSPPTR
jgi:hypothetical protein